MEPGDNIRMVVFTKQEYASKYCKEHGLYVGSICKYIGQDNGSSYIKLKTEFEFSVGIKFLEEHFVKDIRKENLEKLLD